MKNMKMMVNEFLFYLFVFYSKLRFFLDDFIVDDENRPLPKPSHRRNLNAP